MLRFVQALGAQFNPDLDDEAIEPGTLPEPIAASPPKAVVLPPSCDDVAIWARGSQAVTRARSACSQGVRKLTLSAHSVFINPAASPSKADLEAPPPRTPPTMPPTTIWRTGPILP